MSIDKQVPGPLVKLDDLKAASKDTIGTRVVTGSYFSCLRPGVVCEVFKDTLGHKFVECAHGRHYLDHTLNDPDMPSFCTRQPPNENGFLFGFYRYDPDGV